MTKKANSIFNQSKFLKVGKITRPHGIKGELFVSLFAGSPLKWASKKLSSVNSRELSAGRQLKWASKKLSSVNGALLAVKNAKLSQKELSQKEKNVLENALPASALKSIIGKAVQIRKGTELCLEALALEARLHRKGMLVRLQGLEGRLEAETLRGAHFFAPKQIFSSAKGEEIYLCEVLNFEVYDKKRGALGKIRAFSDNGAQDLLIVQSSEKPMDQQSQQSQQSVEIPFIKEFIIDIDFKLKKLFVDLREDWPGLDY